MKNLLNFFVLPVFLLCSFLQMNDLTGKEVNKSEILLESKDQIVYLFFKVVKNNSGAEKVTLEDKKVTEGRLKSMPAFDRNSANIGDFIISLNDENGKEIMKQIVEDPLSQELERFAEEGVSRNKVSLQNAEFSVRYSHSDEIRMIKVEKITKSGNQLLFTEKL